MDVLVRDLKHSFRVFSESRVFAATAIAALALGIGASTAIFSMISAVLLRPLPYPDPSRIVIFTTSSADGSTSAGSPVGFNFLREQTASVFQYVSAYRYGRVNLTAVDHAEEIESAQVSADYFRLFGLTTERGRMFTADEDRPHGRNVVILSDGFWKRAFAGNSRIIGKTISLADIPYEVIGIMAAGPQTESAAAYDTSSAREPADVWRPFQIDPDSTDRNGYLTVAARLKPKVPLSAAAARLQVTTQEFRRRFPGKSMPSSVFAVQPMQDNLVGNQRRNLFFLSGAVSFVLLIACSNVASLLLVQIAGRSREIAIRTAMGATRAHIIRQLLTENIVLSLAGGALGLMLGVFGIRLLLALDTVNIPRIGEHGANVTTDWRVVSYTVAVSLVSGLLIGLIPALRASQADPGAALREGSGALSGGVHENKIRALFVVGEMALALVLLMGAGLMIRHFIALYTVDPGFDRRGVLSMRISLTGPRFMKAAGVADLVRDGVQRIGALPGVVAAAFTCCLPLEDRVIGDVIIAGRPLNGPSHGMVNVATISPGYFDVFKIPLLRGRAFTDRDSRGAVPVVVISETMARKFWQKGSEADPLRESLLFPDLPRQPWQIVGVAGDIHADGLSRPAPPIVYFPVAQAPEELSAYLLRSPMAWIVRTHGESHALSSAIQSALRQSSGGLPVTSIRSMDEILARSTAGREFDMLLLSILGGSALLLAAIGTYGLMAYTVQKRTREIGIRLALGADSSQVRNSIVWQGMRLAMSGVVIGVGAACGLSHLLAGFFSAFKTLDPAVLAVAPILLTGVALLAVWLPARRAGLIDPIVALRYE